MLDNVGTFRTSLSVIADLHSHVHKLAQQAKEQHSNWSLVVPKVVISTHVVRCIHVPESAGSHESGSATTLRFEIVEECQELCQLKAKFQRTERHKHKRKSIADQDDDDEDITQAVDDKDKEINRDALRRILLGLDDDDSSDDDDNLADQFQDAEDMNMKIAVAAADQNMTIDSAHLQQADERVDDRMNMFLDEHSTCCLSRVDLENEAFVQEVLLKSLTRIVDSKGVSDPSPVEPLTLTNILLGCYLEKWLDSVRQTISALQFRKDQSTRQIGEDRELSLVLDCDGCGDGDGTVGMAVAFVQWSVSDSASVNEGRSIKLDEDRRVVCPVNFLQTSRVFKNYAVIVPAAGVQVRRVKKKDRPEVPTHVLRLFDVFNAALVSQSNDGCLKDADVSLDDQQTVCAACNGVCNKTTPMCAVCLLTTHHECQEHLIAAFTTLVIDHGVSTSSSSASSASTGVGSKQQQLAAVLNTCLNDTSADLLHKTFLAMDDAGTTSSSDATQCLSLDLVFFLASTLRQDQSVK